MKNNYWEILKSTIVETDYSKKPDLLIEEEDANYNLLVKTKPDDYNLLWTILANLLFYSYLNNDWSYNDDANVTTYKIGNYTFNDFNYDYYGWHEDDIFSLSKCLSLAIIKVIVDEYNLDNPFDILNYDFKNIDLVEIVDSLFYDYLYKCDTFYGIYNTYSYDLCSRLISNKQLLIHQFKITHVFLKEITKEYFIRTVRHSNDSEFLRIYYTSPLFLLRYEGGKHDISCIRSGWSFFLNEEHLNEFLKNKNRIIQGCLLDIEYSYMKKLQGIDKDLKSIKKENKVLKKKLKNLDTKSLISI